MMKTRYRIILFALLLVNLFFREGLYAQQRVPPATFTFPEDVNTVEIPFTRYRGWIIIKLKANNSRELSFILDTGAPIAVLANKATADSIDMNVIGLAKVAGADGKVAKEVPLATGVKFSFHGIEIENGLVAIGAASEVISGVDGIIGKYIFDGAVVHINWENNTLTLTRPDKFIPPSQCTVVPFQMAPSGHIYTEIQLESNGNKITINGAIDTGNKSGFIVNKSALPESEKKVNTKGLSNVIVSWGANGSVKGEVTRANLFLGDITFTNIITSYTKLESEQLSNAGLVANIGIAILEKFNVTFDYSNKKMYLEKNSSFDKPFFYNRSGIIMNPERGFDYILIADIIKGSPAADNKVLINDKIVTINSKKVTLLSMDEIDGLLSGKTTDEIEIEVMRKSRIIKKKIKMRTLVIPYKPKRAE